jgi:hypothetical protein
MRRFGKLSSPVYLYTCNFPFHQLLIKSRGLAGGRPSWLKLSLAGEVVQWYSPVPGKGNRPPQLPVQRKLDGVPWIEIGLQRHQRSGAVTPRSKVSSCGSVETRCRVMYNSWLSRAVAFKAPWEECKAVNHVLGKRGGWSSVGRRDQPSGGNASCKSSGLAVVARSDSLMSQPGECGETPM